MSNDFAYLTIADAAKKMQAGEITSLELVRAVKKNIDEKNSELNVYLEVFDDIEVQAKAADERRKAGENHPLLLGIPLAIKDNILIEGRHASAASKILENYVATYDATAIRKLKEAGAVFVGRTNMDEFAMGGSTENSGFGPTKNPIDPTRVPGGSSGGSAAAVAAGMALASLGSDTGGSIREPASFCGIVGMKGTYGAVSRHGLMAMGSSLDQIGPLARSVEDAKILFDTMRGVDPLDSTSIKEDLYKAHTQTKKIGVPRDLFKEGIDADVLAHFDETLKKFEKAGYELIDIKLPSASLALALYYIIMPAEASSNLARFDGVRYGLSKKGETLYEDYATTRGEGFGPEVRRRIMLGTYVLSAGYYDAYYGKALAAREALTREFTEALKKVDAIVTPTAPTPASKLGEKSDPLSMYLLDVFTVTANLTGNPAISLPMGEVTRDGKNLPVGIMLTSAHGDEAGMFELARLLA
jgi:aspartyl-tRNA(Asn)/glutamyl-tRNA(Gln) amidotransferase subunit A